MSNKYFYLISISSSDAYLVLIDSIGSISPSHPSSSTQFWIGKCGISEIVGRTLFILHLNSDTNRSAHMGINACP